MLPPTGCALTLPVELTHIENYLTGFTIDYRPFYRPSASDEPEGFHKRDAFDPAHITIHFNQNAPVARQQFTKAHELFHVLQLCDPKCLDFFDALVEDTSLPPSVIMKLIERGADKATAMYLMPTEYFYKRYWAIKETGDEFGSEQLQDLANQFGVSVETAKYRLQEIGQCITPKQLSPMSIDF